MRSGTIFMDRRTIAFILQFGNKKRAAKGNPLAARRASPLPGIMVKEISPVALRPYLSVSLL
jgi:hypothetical protein